MGNKQTVQSLQVAVPSYLNQWKEESSGGHCDLVRNGRTGVLAEQYSIPLDTRISKQQNYWIYEMRRAQKDNIVAVYHIEKEGNQYICQGLDYLRVRTQHIPYRLSQLSNISFPQALYILKQALMGYRAITDFFGSVKVTDQMIGFTPDHKIKVWLNENFAQNLPSEGQKFQFRQPSSIQQRDPHTISLIFDVIEQHVTGSHFPDNFSKAYRQYPIQTFSQAIQFIQDYSSKERIDQRESLVKQVEYVNDTSMVNVMGGGREIHGGVVRGGESVRRYFVQEPPKVRYVMENQIDRSRLRVERPHEQRVIIQPTTIPRSPKASIHHQRIPHNVISSTKTQIGSRPSLPTYQPAPIKPHLLQRSQLILPKSPSFKHQYISTLNLHPQPPLSIPSSPYITQSHIHIHQPLLSTALIPNQKQSVTTVHSQSSVINNSNLIAGLEKVREIPGARKMFARKPKNVTMDSIPGRFMRNDRMNFLSPRK